MKLNIEERVNRARDLFLEGYNCAQSVFMAFNDLFDMDDRFAAQLVAPMGGGIGRLREVCGAVSSMALIAGQLKPAYDPKDQEAKTANYTLVQQLAEKFREENGSIICRELLGMDQMKDPPKPSERTQAYYKTRPCADYVASAARIVGEQLQQML